MLHQILLGAGGGPYGVVAISDFVGGDEQIAPDGASFSLNVNSDKSWDGGTWLTGGDTDYYEVKLVKTSGSTPTGDPLSTWLSTGSNREWSWTVPVGPGVKNFGGTLHIRKMGESVDEDSCTITISVISGS